MCAVYAVSGNSHLKVHDGEYLGKVVCSLTELSSSFSLARLSSKSFSSVLVRPLWVEVSDNGLEGRVGTAIGPLQGWAVMMEESLE